MAATDLAPATGAEGVTWDLSDLLDGRTDEAAVGELLDRGDELAATLAASRGGVAAFDAAALADFMDRLGSLHEVLGRAGSFASLRFAADVTDPTRGALVQRVQERATAMGTEILFFDLEWAALDDDAVEALLADDRLAPYRHHLAAERRYRPYLLSEPEERILTEKAVTGRSAWSRLFSELTSTLEVRLDGRPATLEEALARLASGDREVRRTTAEAVTEALAPGLRTRAYLYNTLLHDKAVDDRLRGYPTWATSRNLSNEASDESVAALVEAVRRRYDIPQRWYRLKAQLLGLDRLADYDRMASVADEEVKVDWPDATDLVLSSFHDFSPTLGDLARRFFDERWIDAPVRPNKRGGAFCAYTTPSVHPFVMLNYTFKRRDVMTLAHELGHGVHAALGGRQGVFHMSTPLTLAETASVFGEQIVFGRLLEQAGTPDSKLALLTETVDGAVATVFRQIAMNRFEHLVHTERREQGELAVERFGELWMESQSELLGDAVDVTDNYSSWWSYIPHFIGSPGYVYAYAYGQLLALAVYGRYEEEGDAFVPAYLELLEAGGSRSPEELGQIVGVDLADPGFWDRGLAIVDRQLEAAEDAARAAGRL